MKTITLIEGYLNEYGMKAHPIGEDTIYIGKNETCTTRIKIIEDRIRLCNGDLDLHTPDSLQKLMDWTQICLNRRACQGCPLDDGKTYIGF